MKSDNNSLGLGILGAATLALSTGWLIHETLKTPKKVIIPCSFNDGISQEDFVLIAKQSGKSIKRIMQIDVENSIVHGVVNSNSGLSTWSFAIDFNDHGHLTGDYHIISNPSDSNIPTLIAQSIQSRIKTFSQTSIQDASPFSRTIKFCPQCGYKRQDEASHFCTQCGSRYNL